MGTGSFQILAKSLQAFKCTNGFCFVKIFVDFVDPQISKFSFLAIVAAKNPFQINIFGIAR